MRKMLFALAGVAGLVLAASPAQARFSPYMASLTLGTGYSDFYHTAIRDNTSGSLAYDARLLIGTRTPLAFEAAYQGTAGFAMDEGGVNSVHDAKIASNAVTGNARVNLSTWRVQPFILGGVGYVNFHSYGRDNSPIAAANFAHSADGLIVPMGGGLSTYLGKHGVLDLRGTYNLITGARDFTATGLRPDMWSAELRGGYAF